MSYVTVGVCVCACGWFGNCSFIFSLEQSDLLALRQSLLLVILLLVHYASINESGFHLLKHNALILAHQMARNNMKMQRLFCV